MLVSFTNYWEKIEEKATWFLNNLKISREQYKEELSQFAQSSADYRYCLRPSYSYPFIEDSGIIYLPTPHLLIQSITTAMMNRLTFAQDALREKIGKNACEGYLLKIVSDSGLFDEVVSEYEYTKGQKTLDILTRKGSIALLIDSKLFSPKVGLRTFDTVAYNNDVDRIVKSLKKTYIQAHDQFNHEYQPFSSTIDDVYALVTVYQEAYIDFIPVYEKTAKCLSIDKDSVEYTWLCTHVGFTDMATLERFMLSKTDVLPEIMNRSAIDGKWLTSWTGTDLSDDVLQYQKKLMMDAIVILDQLYEGIG